MKRVVGLAAALILAGVVGGCADRHESAMREQLDLLKDQNKVLEGVRDKASWQKARPQLDKLAKEIAASAKRMTSLGKLSKERMAELAKKYEKELIAQLQARLAHMKRIALMGIAEDIGPLFKDVGSPFDSGGTD